MKIQKISLLNLNSLKGTHAVDLTAEPLSSAGIFAITGPTGAGKTTLLDAVTLALYGRVARYANESNPENVMTRHCGECSAEVQFEVSSGIYRALWQRHRSRKHPDGAMQSPKRYIYDASGTPLTHQIRDTEEKIEELLGLNYDRFLRSVLLAQGEFARFLTARPDERAELLESLTGTAIYSRLGRLAHTEAGEKEQELQAKETELDRITVLDSEARTQLEAAIRAGESERADLGERVTAGVDTLAKIDRLERARQQEITAGGDLQAVEHDRSNARKDFEQLTRHRQTLPFAEDLIRMEAAKTHADEAAALSEAAGIALATAVAELARARNALSTVARSELAALHETLKSATEAVERTRRTAAEAAAWLKEHRQDAVLTDMQGDLLAAIGDVKISRGSLAMAWKAWKTSAEDCLASAARALPEEVESAPRDDLEAMLSAYLARAAEEETRLVDQCDEAWRQLKLRQDHLNKSRLVVGLEDHRHSLKDGEPCSLCGALEHPYAQHGSPETKLSELESEVAKADAHLARATADSRRFRTTHQLLDGGRGDLYIKVEVLEEGKRRLAILLEPLALAVPSPGDEDEVRTSLQSRERAYRERAEIERRAQAEEQAAAKAAEVAAGRANVVEERMQQLAPPLSDLEQSADGDLPSMPDAEQAYSAAVNEDMMLVGRAADRAADSARAQEKLQEATQALHVALDTSAFSTVEELQKARLPGEEASRIEGLATKIATRQTAAETLLNQARTEVRALLDENILEGAEAEAFRTLQAKLTDKRDALLRTLTTNQNALKSDDEQREQRARKEAGLADDRKKLAVWRKLRGLIGSHDGGRFRRYAQTISLDILARHANRHLTRLSDRYRIRRDLAEVLNLQIEDLDQADATRPMASLSGGESFLVSLSLALGVSDLAGRRVRIDSLFIDEGFGTLDPETLEVALSALESLRQSGKMVGVISHVGLLKERMCTQIVVQKRAGGISDIRVVSV